MSPRKSSEPEDPPELRELEPELRELELEEPLLRELEELDEREPLLKDCPPPGRARRSVLRGTTTPCRDAGPRANPGGTSPSASRETQGAAVAHATDSAMAARFRQAA
jgi:hypothetical protein